MIRPSQRRSKRPPSTPQPPFELHRRLARRRRRRLRLLFCSAGALFLSLILWLAGVPLPLHLGGVALGFALGFLAPLKPQEPWALSWIENETGLSYRTALEHENANDAYGFHGAVAVRAQDLAGRLEPPAEQPWWLPALVLALGLVVLPAVGLPGFSLPGGRGLVTQAPADTPADASPDTPESPPAEAEGGESETPQDAPAETPVESAAGSDARDFDTSDGSEGGAGGTPSEGSDSEALSSFLDARQEQTSAQEAGAPQGGGAPPPNESASDTDGAARGAGNPQAAPVPANAQPSTASRGDEGTSQEGAGAQGAAGEEQGEQSASGEEQGEGQEGNEGAEGAAQGERDAQETAEQSQTGPAQAEQPQGQEQSAQEEGSTEQADDQEGAQDAGAPGDAAQAGAQEGNGEAQGVNAPASGEDGEGGALAGDGGGDGAGDGGSLQGLAEPAPGLEGSPQTPPEFLGGRRQEGASTLSGALQLPGADPGTRPTGEAAGDFDRSVERAITEGRIPVEYQEMLRNYFR